MTSQRELIKIDVDSFTEHNNTGLTDQANQDKKIVEDNGAFQNDKINIEINQTPVDTSPAGVLAPSFGQPFRCALKVLDVAYGSLDNYIREYYSSLPESIAKSNTDPEEVFQRME